MSLRKWVVRSWIQKSRWTSYTTPLTVGEQKQRHDRKNGDKRYFKIGVGTLLGSVLVGTNTNLDKNKKELTPTVKAANKPVVAGSKRPELPTYRAEDVTKHDTKTSFWVTYKHGVYDITEFLTSHPGGEQIYNAAGLSIEPFWNVYGMHNTPEIHALLESYRIGNLHDDDVVEHSEDDLWVREPFRDKRLIVKTAKPFNAEIPPEHQIAHFNTPNELFYVRQHMPVPDLEESTHKLKIKIVNKGVICKEFSLQELEQFKKGTVRAALMCAGNRRSEMSKEVQGKEVKGISWAGGAISNAEWSGVYLRDVLIKCGVDEHDTEGKHVIFQGSDIDATGVNFSTSIPLSMALNPQGSVLLATHMNGAPLPRDHGYPLRGVVPGAPAVRSVKWLESITVSEDESESHWHQKDYRSFNASDTWETADFPNAPPVYSLPVTSAICDPADGDTVQPTQGYVEARGYAYSGGGARIVRVDVSADGGGSWRAAALCRDSAPHAQHYAWALWTARLPVRRGQEEMEIWVKATDSNFNTQPEKFEHIWNIRGILSNAYHKIKIKLKD